MALPLIPTRAIQQNSGLAAISCALFGAKIVVCPLFLCPLFFYFERQLDEAKRRIGELVMEVEILQKERRAKHPLAGRRSSQ